jgi:hypothetical protein
VFCTLWSLGHSQNTKEFIDHTNLEDMSLPFVPDNPPNNLPQTLEQSNFWRDFCKEQWRLFAPELESHVLNLHFADERENIIQFWKGLFKVIDRLKRTPTMELIGSEEYRRIFLYVSLQVSGLLPPYLVSDYVDFGLQTASRY